MRLLIVEDDSVTRFHWEILLKSLGHEVAVASNVTDAWRHLADGSIQIVLADWLLPGVAGPEFCRQIRQRGGPYIYFILVTNQADSPENYAATLGTGVDDYMHKPLQIDELKLRLAAAVKTLQQIADAKTTA